DADLQMAGYAAALETLTRYAYINGRDMIQEARDAQNTRAMAFVDELIAFAVELANRHLIPQGLARTVWEKLSPSERFYLKMVELESRGLRTLDNYQNFAKAFRVANFRDLMAVDKANNARLKGAVELGRGYMERTALLGETATRAVLYAMMELVRQVDGDAVLAHLRENLPGFVGDLQVRERAVAIAKYLEVRLRQVRPEESRAARVLVELIDNERLR
ncbi:MAG TPA: DNA methylase, partial [Candidatus Hydrogenedentes bacterium]|nr:DNA methylase [Candidatus Hydrogenedentota bacterium]